MKIPLVADCLETRDSLSDLADGDLDRRRRWRVIGHLAMCRHCRAVWRALRVTINGLRVLGSPQPEPQPALVEAVAQRIRAEE
jgi:predicted anti-sigma-YlaC factor YlaD